MTTIIHSAAVARHRLGIGSPLLLDPAHWADPIITSEHRRQQRRVERWRQRQAQHQAGRRPDLELWGIPTCRAMKRR